MKEHGNGVSWSTKNLWTQERQGEQASVVGLLERLGHEQRGQAGLAAGESRWWRRRMVQMDGALEGSVETERVRDTKAKLQGTQIMTVQNV